MIPQKIRNLAEDANSIIGIVSFIFALLTALFAYISQKIPYLGAVDWPTAALYGVTVAIMASISIGLIASLIIKIGKQKHIDEEILNIKKSIKENNTQIDISIKSIQSHQALLNSAIRIRDAEKIWEKFDKDATKLSEALLSNSQSAYQTASQWKNDFHAWKGCMSSIDDLLKDWLPNERRFLDITTHEFENYNLMVGTNDKIIDSENTIRFRTALIAANKYYAERIRIKKFFDRKAEELPS